MIAVAVALAWCALVMGALRVATRSPRPRFDLSPGWLGPGTRAVARHGTAPDPGRDWMIA